MKIPIEGDSVGERLDVIVSRATGFGRAHVRRLFEDGKVGVWVGERRRPARKGDRGIEGMHLELADTSHIAAIAEDGPLNVRYETDSLVIVDKPAGVASAPIRAGERTTIANALVARYPEMTGIGYSPREPGLCHRLDTGTSGLLMAARNAAAFAELTAAIAGGTMEKRYLLVCASGSLDERGTIETALESRGPRVRVVERGRVARTGYRVIERHRDRVLVEAHASPATRHQVRVHFAHCGAPLVGDVIYGGRSVAPSDRHALHASYLRYPGGERVARFTVTSDLPEELRAWLSR